MRGSHVGFACWVQVLDSGLMLSNGSASTPGLPVAAYYHKTDCSYSAAVSSMGPCHKHPEDKYPCFRNSSLSKCNAAFFTSARMV